MASGKTAEALGFRKYGHCGTLDPDATGLLVVLLGKATRLASFLSGEIKRYSFTVVTGVSTDTLDMSGEVTERADDYHLSIEAVTGALEKLTGNIQQQVPLYSAVRVEGKRGYKLARKGEKPEMPVRTVTVSNWTVHGIEGDRIKLEVTVSAGTYVRALARDIGRIIGVPSAADSIRRVSAGVFSVNEASPGPDTPDSLLSMADAVGRVMKTVTLTGSESYRIVNGMEVPRGEEGIRALLDTSGRLLAIGSGNGVSIRPSTVLMTPEKL